jgi:hypothetical protein
MGEYARPLPLLPSPRSGKEGAGGGRAGCSPATILATRHAPSARQLRDSASLHPAPPNPRASVLATILATSPAAVDSPPPAGDGAPRACTQHLHSAPPYLFGWVCLPATAPREHRPRRVRADADSTPACRPSRVPRGSVSSPCEGRRRQPATTAAAYQGRLTGSGPECEPAVRSMLGMARERAGVGSCCGNCARCDAACAPGIMNSDS